MSGLGTTVEPTGEPGSIVSSRQEVLLPETLPSNDATIAQTTSVNTLEQACNRDYIRQGTYTWSTTMPAGTVIAAIRVHPNNCNFVNRHVNKLFNAWTGGMKGRMRALATAWYGGDLRMGKLPPNMTEDEVFQTPLSVLTAHPNESLDPKNTGWIHFRLSDQRPIAYHYNGLLPTDPNSHGGWFVIFVAGRLVTQSEAFTQVDIVLEFAGDFTWDQLAPREPVSDDVDEDPLSYAAQVPLHMQPILDSGETGVYNVVIVNPSSITHINCGSIVHSAIGLPMAVGKTTGLTTDNVDALNFQQSREFSSVQWLHGPSTALVGSDYLIGATDQRLAANCERTAELYAPCFENSGTDSVTFRTFNGVDWDISGSTIQWKTALSDPIERGQNDVYNYAHNAIIPSDLTTPINPSLAGPVGTKLTSATPNASGESIVTFGNLAHRTISTQTEIMAEALGKYSIPLHSGHVSKLYALKGVSGTPLAIFRLNPNGVWSAPATSTATMYPAADLTFTYLQDLPVSEPIPAPSFFMRSLAGDLRMVARRCCERQMRPFELMTELADMIRSY